jgi:hypothetical protein
MRAKFPTKASTVNTIMNNGAVLNQRSSSQPRPVKIAMVIANSKPRDVALAKPLFSSRLLCRSSTGLWVVSEGAYHRGRPPSSPQSVENSR